MVTAVEGRDVVMDAKDSARAARSKKAVLLIFTQMELR
jgi:hypothetical protein